MNLTSEQIARRFEEMEAARDADRIRLEQRLARSERRLHVTWTAAAVTAAGMFALGWHKDAVAQVGVTLVSLNARLTAVETKTQDITRLTDPMTDQPTVRFSGVNVQVVNGSGTTGGATNGLGNLIIGYNEAGRADQGRGGIDRNDIRTGSHNLVLGTLNNYGSYGSFVGGSFNATTAPYSAVLGYLNTVSGNNATITAGEYNIAAGYATSVTGGNGNTASGQYASVSGGNFNTASGNYSSVSGGRSNTSIGQASSVSGGNQRSTASQYGWAAGTSLDR